MTATITEAGVDVAALIADANAAHNAAEDAELRADATLQESQAWRWQAAEAIWTLCQALPSQDAVAFALGRDENFQSSVSMYKRVWDKFGSSGERPSWKDATYFAREKLPAAEQRDLQIAFLESQPGKTFVGTQLELATAAGIPVHTNNAHRNITGWDGVNLSRDEASVRATGKAISYVQEGSDEKATWRLVTGAEAEIDVIISGCAARIAKEIEPFNRIVAQLELITDAAIASEYIGRLDATMVRVDAAIAAVRTQMVRLGSEA